VEKNWEYGSEKNGTGCPWSRPRTVLDEAMLTTAGIAALATDVQPLGGAPPGCATATLGPATSTTTSQRTT
jgi:hypothetical protein